jgi:hypothetical protein
MKTSEVDGHDSFFIQAISRVIMSPTELKMQPTIRLERDKNPALPSKCIVSCILNSIGLIVTREIPCIYNLFISSTSTVPQYHPITFNFHLLNSVIKLFQRVIPIKPKVLNLL